jgi:hypothetical protein
MMPASDRYLYHRMIVRSFPLSLRSLTGLVCLILLLNRIVDVGARIQRRQSDEGRYLVSVAIRACTCQESDRLSVYIQVWIGLRNMGCWHPGKTFNLTRHRHTAISRRCIRTRGHWSTRIGTFPAEFDRKLAKYSDIPRSYVFQSATGWMTGWITGCRLDANIVFAAYVHFLRFTQAAYYSTNHLLLTCLSCRGNSYYYSN